MDTPMNNKPCVDVVIPVFNGQQSIKAALSSIFSQHGNCVNKVIVIDDGSTDGTAEEIEALCHPQIQLVCTANKGVSKARNLGIKQATAEWIAFLDADDTWLPDKLHRQLDAAQEHEAGFVCASVGTQLQLASGKITKALLARGNFIATSSVLVRRSILQTIQPAFTPDMSFAEDYLAWLKCLTLTKGYYLSTMLVNYSISPRSRYGWGEILLNMIDLNLRYAAFLYGTRLSVADRIKLSLAVCIGTLRSLASILRRIAHSYTVSHPNL